MALSPLLTPLLPAIYLAAGAVAAGLLAKAFGALRNWMVSKPKLAPLAPVADVADEALTDGIKAVEKDAGKPALVLLTDAGEAALADVKANKDTLLSAVEAEAKTLVDPAKPLSNVTPGGLSDNLPKGFATLALMAALALGAAAAVPAAAPSAPIAPYDFGMTLPGLKFPWGGGGSPIQVAGGAGFFGEYNLVPVTVPVLGTVPLLSLGVAIIGDVVPDPALVSYELSMGPQVCVLHSLCLSLQSDLIAGGPSNISGVLAGKFALANEAGMILFNTSALVDAFTTPAP
jgi:hypothetical protein